VIRVLLAEDHHVVREGLVALLRLTSDIDVVAEVGRGDQVVPHALKTSPDVAVIDIEMPGLDGIGAAAQLKAALPTCPVLILTGFARVRHLRRALEAGVAGFLLKDAPVQRVTESIRQLAAGGLAIDPALAAQAIVHRPSPLTPREQAIVALIGTGASTCEIARELCLTTATVRNYISRVICKTGARNRTDAARIARESGWI
jgi:two-component system response regulator DesR